MEPTETPFIDCNNKSLNPEQLFRLLLCKVGENPALRTVSADTYGPIVEHFISSNGQTIFTMAKNIRNDVAWFRNGAIKHSETISAVIGQKDIEIAPQPLGTELTFIY